MDGYFLTKQGLVPSKVRERKVQTAKGLPRGVPTCRDDEGLGDST